MKPTIRWVYAPRGMSLGYWELEFMTFDGSKHVMKESRFEFFWEACQALRMHYWLRNIIREEKER